MERLHENPVSSIDGCETVEQLPAPERLIKVVGESISLEITQMCRTDCPACYTAGRAHLHGEHLHPEVIFRRIDWIVRHTNALEITLLGGEPLLHPHLEEIIAYVLHCGLAVEIITSGVTSVRNQNEKSNLALVLEKYQEGTLNIQLSLHPGKNQKHFKKIIGELRDRTSTRAKAQTKRKQTLEKLLSKAQVFDQDSQKGMDLLQKQLVQVDKAIASKTAVHTTVTLGPEMAMDEQKFLGVYRFIVEDCHGCRLEDMTVKGEKAPPDHFRQKFITFQKHFASFGQSNHFIDSLDADWPADKSWQIRVWGAIGVTKNYESGRQIIRIRRPMGNEGNAMACSAMSSSANHTTGEVSLDGALIRADGELVHANPGCIEMKHGFANVDLDDDSGAIFQRASTRLTAIDKLIHKIDALHQSERPTTDKDCVSCPFDIACNLCVNTTPNRAGNDNSGRI